MPKTSRWQIGRDSGFLAYFPLCSNFQLLALSLGQATAILWTPVSTGWSSTSDAFLSPSLSSPSSSPKQSLPEIFNLEAQKKMKRPSHLRRTPPHPTPLASPHIQNTVLLMPGCLSCPSQHALLSLLQSRHVSLLSWTSLSRRPTHILPPGTQVYPCPRGVSSNRGSHRSGHMGEFKAS